MKKSDKIKTALRLVVMGVCVSLFGESFDFASRDIGDILFAVSAYKGFPVTADDTVTGAADFRCASDDFDAAFDSFLQKNRLYVQKSPVLWTVSKIRIERRNDTFSLDAYDVSPARIFERLGTDCGICVVSESLPQVAVSVHTGFCSPEELVRRVSGLCGGFEAVKEKSGFYRMVRTGSGQTIGAQQTAGRAEFSLDDDGRFTCDVVNAQLAFALEKAFTLAKKQFCIVSGGEGKIVRAQFSGACFDDAVTLLCLQCGAETALVDGVYYVFASKGAREKLASAGKQWSWYHVKHRTVPEIAALAAKRFASVEVLATNDQGDMLYCADEQDVPQFLQFVASVDTALPIHLVRLQYVRTSDFFAHLPPFIEKTQVSDSGQGDSFYFTGPDELYERLLEELPRIDKPVTRISYAVLIMQYQHSNGYEWMPSFRAERLQVGDVNNATALVGSVLDFNLDVIGAFGLHFAAQLQAAITSARAQVFADTTLNGVSGSTISFQNTNTYRYRDNNLDPDTGKPIYSGITKEIISGLKLEVTGTVTGDGMITSKITASVSRQGTDTSSATGNPPPTSEKVITTEVRAKSGEPVVLSGLVQDESSVTDSRVPFFGRIPLLGWLFKAKQTSAEKTEMVIYLVPSAETTESQSALDVVAHEKKEMARVYKEFVR